MKTAVKVLLILIAFMLAHEGLRLAFMQAGAAYEISHHCGCARPSLWVLWAFRFANFFFEWPTGNYYLSDFIWGSIATALYLWIGKRRKTKRWTREVSAGVQAGVWPPAPKML